MNAFLKTLLSRWKLLTCIAATIAGTASTFLLKTAALSYDDSSGDALAAFCVAIVLSLSIWITTRLRKATLAKFTFGTIGAIFLSFLVYKSLLFQWTVKPLGISRPLIMGTVLSAAAEKYLSDNGLVAIPLSRDNAIILIENASYHSTAVWQDSLLARWAVLLAMYVMLISAVSASIIGALRLIS